MRSSERYSVVKESSTVLFIEVIPCFYRRSESTHRIILYIYFIGARCFLFRSSSGRSSIGCGRAAALRNGGDIAQRVVGIVVGQTARRAGQTRVTQLLHLRGRLRAADVAVGVAAGVDK